MKPSLVELVGQKAAIAPLLRSIALGMVVLAVGCSPPPTTIEPTASESDAAATTTPDETSTLGAIAIDGSSTVYPLTDEIAKEYLFEHRNDPQGVPDIVVNFSGSSAGFRAFCAGETDISNASRPINQEEIDTCAANGIEFVELPVALDALTVVVHPDNEWADSITLEELRTLWGPEAEEAITEWSQVRSDWPAEEVQLYGPGADSGTFDYFTEVVMGDSGESRTDYFDSEDDTDLVLSIKDDPNALGYFGYAYFEENQTRLKPVAIDSGNGPVLPSIETVMDGSYQPFTRPLFIYVNRERAEENPVLNDFVSYYMENARNVVQVVGYVPLPDEVYNIALSHFEENKVGTVFGGEASPDMTVEELLELERAF